VTLITLKPRIPRIDARLPKPAEVQRKRGSTGVKERNAVRARDNWLCQACFRQGVIRLGADVDHIHPLHLGGSDDPSNKELLCREHHDEKSAREAAGRSAPSEF
jgi:5-methylcytosine-specific restriction protein A